MIATDTVVAVWGFAGVALTATGAFVGVWYQNRKTRNRNTDEHAMTAMAIRNVHEDVIATRTDVGAIRLELHEHVSDKTIHHPTTVVNVQAPASAGGE